MIILLSKWLLYHSRAIRALIAQYGRGRGRGPKGNGGIKRERGGVGVALPINP